MSKTMCSVKENIIEIEKELGDWGFVDEDSGRWRCWDYVLAQGSTLEEILDDATVFASDQDGGEAGCDSLGDLPTSLMDSIIGILTDEWHKPDCKFPKLKLVRK